MITVGSSTPWGHADCVEQVAPGIISVSTPSHGGYKVYEPYLSAMHPMLQDTFRGMKGWFEEDCDWAKVAIAYPKLFSAEYYTLALSIIKSYNTPLYQAIMSGEVHAVNS